MVLLAITTEKPRMIEVKRYWEDLWFSEWENIFVGIQLVFRTNEKTDKINLYLHGREIASPLKSPFFVDSLRTQIKSDVIYLGDTFTEHDLMCNQGEDLEVVSDKLMSNGTELNVPSLDDIGFRALKNDLDEVTILEITHKDGFIPKQTYALRFAFLMKSPERPLKLKFAKLTPKVEQTIHLYSLSGIENLHQYLVRREGALMVPIDLFRISEDGRNISPSCQLFVYVPKKWKIKSNLLSIQGGYDVLNYPYSRKRLRKPYVGYGWDMFRNPRFASSPQIEPMNYPPLRVSMETASLSSLFNVSVIFLSLSAFCYALLKLSNTNSMIIGTVAAAIYALFRKFTAIGLD